jgi:YhcH/YjgK/YiaL family protein
MRGLLTVIEYPMIYDIAANIINQTEAVQKAVGFVQGFDRSLPDGRYTIDGDNIFGIVQTVTTQHAGERSFEAHKLYTDVQMVLDGCERQDAALLGLEDMPVVQEYDKDKDIIFFGEPSHFSTIIMKPGIFVVYRPDDAHRPCCCVGAPSLIRKVCVKIRIR